MFSKLEAPLFIREAVAQKKPHPLWVELLIFGVVFWVGGILQSVLLMPFTVVAMLGRMDEILALTESGSPEALVAFVTEMQKTPLLVIGSLLATVGMIVTVILYCRLLEKRSVASLGMRRPFVREYALGAFWGVVLFGGYVAFSMALGNLTFLGISEKCNVPMLLLLLICFLIQGFSEEILCRGYFMTSLCRTMPLPWALVLSSLFFSLFHVGNPGVDVLGLINIFLFGILMGLYMIRRGDIWGAAALHALWNFAEGCLADFSVSGLSMPSSLLAFGKEGASVFVAGGAFGPESGFAVTFVTTLGIVILLMMKNKDVKKD